MEQVPDADAVQVQVWSTELGNCMRGSLIGLLGLSFHTGRAYLQSRVDRKDSWHLAEHAGEFTPGGMQRLRNQADWDADEVRTDAYLAAHVAERDAGGRRLVVRNGHARQREVLTAAGAIPVRTPRVDDRRVDPGDRRADTVPVGDPAALVPQES